MKRLFLSFVALALLAGSIAACGQKGPLYLPDDEKPRKNTAKTATVSGESAHGHIQLPRR